MEGRLKLNHTDSYIKYKSLKLSNLMPEFIKLDKKSKTQLYVIYKKLILNVKL